MSVLQLQSRIAWNDYFSVTNPTCYNLQIYSSKPAISGTNVYISDCLFRSITSSSDGGAYHSSNSVMILLIESSSFHSCMTSSANGGAIYFYHSSGGQCVLHEVCGYDCCCTYKSSTTNYQFAYIRVNCDSSSKNYINYSSIVRCVNEDSNSCYTLRLCCGKGCCPSVNISMNKCF
jgi:hypothetical protein